MTTSELHTMKTRLALLEAMDAALEVAIRDHTSLEDTLRAVSPLLAEATGCPHILVVAPDEALQQRRFCFGPEEVFSPLSALLTDPAPARAVDGPGGGRLLVYPLDTAGVTLGLAALWAPRPLADEALAAALLQDWAEALDNQLASIAQAREKHRLGRITAAALRHPILDQGLGEAMAALQAQLPITQLLLIGHEAEERSPDSLLCKLTPAPSLAPEALDRQVQAELDRFLGGAVDPLADALGLDPVRLQLPVTGFKDEVVGRLVVARPDGGFSTEVRDLLESFVDALRQRLVDYNREWKHLSLCFSSSVVRQLLSAPSYRARYLEPREAELAVLYADISGFTRISEQVLVDPKLIGQLVDVWSRRVVEILWAHGGVFDKLVGDCVIGLFGPPFFDGDRRRYCQAALAAAEEIRDDSRTLGAVIPQLADTPVGVATGLNCCPALVGLLGPNEAYTCVSRGMNNTARLQGLAQRDEILVMDRFADALGQPERLDSMRASPVKNVAEPLRYYAILPRLYF